MKTRISIYFALIASAFMLTACPETDIDKLLEIDGPIEFEKTYNIDIKEGDSFSFTDINEIETSYNGIDIKDVEINSISIEIANYETEGGAIVLTDMVFYFEGDEDNQTRVLGQDLSTIEEFGEIDLKFQAEEKLLKYEDYLLANKNAKMIIITEVDGPVKFDYTFKLSATVTGTPSN